MALPSDEYGRIAAWLSGEMNEAERAAFEAWRQESPERKRITDDLTQVWAGSDIKFQDDAVNTDEEWNFLHKNISESVPVRSMYYDPLFWIKIAASVVIMVSVGLWFFGENDSRIVEQKADTEVVTEHSPAHTTIAATSTVNTFYLPDSTRVWLRPGSSLSYTLDVSSPERQVFLEGEAFFKVKRDESRPFIVKSGQATVQVLGTSFNVNQRDTQVILSVEEGLVRYNIGDSVASKGLLVRAQEAARVSRGKPEKSKLKDTSYASWRKKNNPMYDSEVASPGSFVKADFFWKKNTINRSVIRGTLISSAELATYRKITVSVSYRNAKGKTMKTDFVVDGPLKPGQKVNFEKKLLDIFRDPREMKVVVTNATIVE